MNTLPDICPDYGPRRQTRRRIDEARFGDGYAQRRPAGINSSTDTYQLNWTMLERDDFATLYGFLRAHQGAYAFWWQAPWDDAMRRWRCTDLSADEPTSATLGAIAATFEEDHNP